MCPSSPASAGASSESSTELANAVMAASRVFVAISAESLDAATEQLDLTQFRALVVIVSHDGMSLGELAQAARIHPSRASRVCDALVGDGLVTRVHSDADRRQVVLRATAAGHQLVDQVWAERRRAITTILDELNDSERAGVVSAMQAFVNAAGERSDYLYWEAGWTT